MSVSKKDVVHETIGRRTVDYLTPLLASILLRNGECHSRAGWKLLCLMVNEVIDGLERLRMFIVDVSRLT